MKNDFIPKMDEQDDKKACDMTTEERKWYILGAIKSTLFIWLVYGTVFGLAILIMYLCFLKK